MSINNILLEYNNFINYNINSRKNYFDERIKYIKTINKLKELGFNYFNDKWNINFDKIYIDLELYEFNIEKHIENNNLDVIKFFYYNNINICSNTNLIYSIKYNKLDILKFIHITCTKKCILIKELTELNLDNKIHKWLCKNCIYYEK